MASAIEYTQEFNMDVSRFASKLGLFLIGLGLALAVGIVLALAFTY